MGMFSHYSKNGGGRQAEEKQKDFGKFSEVSPNSILTLQKLHGILNRFYPGIDEKRYLPIMGTV